MQRSQQITDFAFDYLFTSRGREPAERMRETLHGLAPVARRNVLAMAFAVAGVTSLSGCAAMHDFSEQFADEARYWGDHATAAVLGDDPARD